MAAVTGAWESHLQTLKDEALHFSRKPQQCQHHCKINVLDQHLQSVTFKRQPSLPPLRNVSALANSETALDDLREHPRRTPVNHTPKAPPKRIDSAGKRPTPRLRTADQSPTVGSDLSESNDTLRTKPEVIPKSRPLVEVAGTKESSAIVCADPKAIPKKILSTEEVSERMLAEFILQGSTADVRLAFDTSWRQRPGVSNHCLLTSARLIQQTWRFSRAQRQLTQARLHLGCNGTAARQISTATGHFSQCSPGQHQTCTNARQLLPEISWDEAAAYRQPSVHDVLLVQRRWTFQSEILDQQSQLANLNIAETSATLKEMVQYEKRFQLRAGPHGAWRPPSALGESACKILEAKLLLWTAAIQDSPVLDSLLVCLCLFKLVVAGSCLSRGQCGNAENVLQFVDDILDGSFEKSYLHAVAPQIRARVFLLQARRCLIRQELDTALMFSQRALVLLNDRHGPRDFWPPHCWEFAACHRTKVLSLACVSQPQKASAALRDLVQLVSPAPMREAEPQLTAILDEEASAMRVECEVLERADAVSMQSSGPPAETLHSLLGFTEGMLKKMIGIHARARTLAVLAKLHLLQELQWYAAGAGRPETIEIAAGHLYTAFGALGIAGVLQKVLPARIVCLVLSGHGDSGIALTDSWLAACRNTFGERDGLTLRAGLAAEDLQKVLSSAGVSTKHTVRALRNVLACTGVGIRDAVAV